MADVTARLLWYRLNESTQHLIILWDGLKFMVAAGGTILNYVFIFWIVIGLLTVLVVTVLQTNDGLHAGDKRTHAFNAPSNYICARCKEPSECVDKERSASRALDKRSWLNCVLSWMNQLDNEWKRQVTDTLLASMTEQSRKIGGDLFVTFESLLPVGDAPQISVASTEGDAVGSKFLLKGELELSAFQLSLTASDNSVAIHSNLLLVVHVLKSNVDIELQSMTDCLSINIKSREITAMDIQFAPYHQGIDCITDERKLNQHVTSIFTNIDLALKIAINPERLDVETASISEEVGEPESTHGSSSVPPKPPRSIEDKKLMIKLIKATKLNKRNPGVKILHKLIVKVINARGLHAWRFCAMMDAYCIVEINRPYQTHSTSIVKNTVNPYWDEHFLFDLDTTTSLVTFRVYASSHNTDDIRNCLGESTIDIEKLRYNHGVRIVLPLESRSATALADPTLPVSGSVTIEAFFVESAEFDSPVAAEHDDVFAQSVEPLLNVSDADAEDNVDLEPATSSPSATSNEVDRLQSLTLSDGSSHQNIEDGSLPDTQRAPKGVSSDSTGSKLGIDMNNAEVITVHSSQSVSDVIIKELTEMSNRPDCHSTIIITSSHRSDDSSTGTPCLTWESNHQQTDSGHTSSRTTVSQPSALPTAQRGKPAPLPMSFQHLDVPKTERKSRLSGLKKRFTKNKDKKARSHSVEKSSGLDENKYLRPPPYSANIEPSQSDTSMGELTLKRKLGGSLRKLFRRRSSSRSHRKSSELNDLDRPAVDHYDRLSIEGSRPEERGSRSSFERDMTPPHHRPLSQQASYGSQYAQPHHSSDPMRSDGAVYGPTPAASSAASSNDWMKHHSLPSHARNTLMY